MAAQDWERKPRESEAAYKAFIAFRDMGMGRLLKTHPACTTDLPRRSYQQVKQWSSKWHWTRRALAWDRHNSAVQQKAVDKVTAGAAFDWATARLNYAKVDLEISHELQKKAAITSRMPTTRQTRSQDGTTIIVEPVDARDLRDAAALAQAAAALAWTVFREMLPDDEAEPIDLQTATLPELRAWLDRNGRGRGGQGAGA